ncbi:MAG: S-layer homology domain-containing protein [Actinomycetia bacterium]|nr:S-layer homology domain-containing protein [Actinomycetes bacterium]
MHLTHVIHTGLGSNHLRRLRVSLLCGGSIVLALVMLMASLALAAGPSFPDVSSSNPYYPAITDLSSRGIIGGYANGNFGPNDIVKRMQFAKMIVGALGITPNASTDTRFADLGTPDANGYPHRFIQTAYDYGITTGTNTAQTLYSPTNPIRRDQVVSMIVRGANSVFPGTLENPPPGTVSLFAGVGDPHGPNLRIAEYNGLLGGLVGMGSAWSITANATRGEVAQMLYNLLGKITPGSTTTTTTSAGSPLKIVSVHYDAAGDDNKNLNDEYVVFQVLRSGSLAGYAVEDEYGWHYDFPSRTFSSGESFKLHTGSGVDTQTDLYWNQTSSAVWNNDGDTVKVLDSQGRVLTSYHYQD